MKKKIFSIVICILLVFCFSLTAFAGEWRTINGVYFDNHLYYSYDYVEGRNTYTQLIRNSSTESGVYKYELSTLTNTDGWSSEDYQDVLFLSRVSSTFVIPSVTAGDSIVITPKVDTVSGWFGGANNDINGICYVIAEKVEDSLGGYWYNIIAQGSFFNNVVFTPADGGRYYSVKLRTAEFTIRESYENVVVCLGFSVDLTTGNTFTMNRLTFDVGYGEPSSPNRPIYTPPDKNPVDDYKDAEDAVLDDTAQGREDASNILSLDSFVMNIGSYLTGLSVATALINLCFDTLTPFRGLIYLSLALGFLSFVLSMVQMVVGKASKSDAQNTKNNNKRGAKDA